MPTNNLPSNNPMAQGINKATPKPDTSNDNNVSKNRNFQPSGGIGIRAFIESQKGREQQQHNTINSAPQMQPVMQTQMQPVIQPVMQPNCQPTVPPQNLYNRQNVSKLGNDIPFVNPMMPQAVPTEQTLPNMNSGNLYGNQPFQQTPQMQPQMQQPMFQQNQMNMGMIRIPAFPQLVPHGNAVSNLDTAYALNTNNALMSTLNRNSKLQRQQTLPSIDGIYQPLNLPYLDLPNSITHITPNHGIHIPFDLKYFQNVIQLDIDGRVCVNADYYAPGVALTAFKLFGTDKIAESVLEISSTELSLLGLLQYMYLLRSEAIPMSMITTQHGPIQTRKDVNRFEIESVVIHTVISMKSILINIYFYDKDRNHIITPSNNPQDQCMYSEDGLRVALYGHLEDNEAVEIVQTLEYLKTGYRQQGHIGNRIPYGMNEHGITMDHPNALKYLMHVIDTLVSIELI